MDYSAAHPLTDEDVVTAISTANVPALLMTVYQFTGDRKWLQSRYRPTRARGLGAHLDGGLPEDVQAEIRAAAVPVILAMQNGEPPAIPVLSPAQTVELVSIYLGESIADRYGPMLSDELARRSATGEAMVEKGRIDAPSGYKVVLIGLGVAGIAGAHYLDEMGLDYTIYLGESIADRYGPMLSDELARRSATGEAMVEKGRIDAPSGYKVVLIGLGVAGIAGAHYLDEMGLDYTIFERHKNAGGVWFDNTYPGAGVDTPSHLYSFSFLDRDWEKHFELQPELLAYFSDAVDELGIRDRVRFGTEVLSAEFDDSTLKWTVTVRSEDGTIEHHIADVVISAVGSLNKPRLPQLPGMDSFTGQQFHSSNWPEGIDLTGKRVAIVGTGASSMQITPRIAGVASEVVVFQRSPQWVAPFEQFNEKIEITERELMAANRIYHAWVWIRLFWNFGDKVIEALRVDPNWEHPDRSVNARNDGHRKLFTRYLEEQLGDRTDLLPKVLPHYPPFGKRILLDNGWYAALKRDNVQLVAEHVESVQPEGPVSESGEVYPVDVIIWATGFQAARFLESVDVVGSGGVHLHKQWHDDDPHGYLGTSIPGFPNFFTLGGPHSFPGSGSFMFFMEVQGRYLRDLITGMLDLGATAIDPLPEVTDRYNQLVDEVHARTVWTHPGFGTYYRNSKGRVIFVMPFLNLEYWEFTRQPDFENYLFHFADGSTKPGSDVVGVQKTA